MNQNFYEAIGHGLVAELATAAASFDLTLRLLGPDPFCHQWRIWGRHPSRYRYYRVDFHADGVEAHLFNIQDHGPDYKHLRLFVDWYDPRMVELLQDHLHKY